MNEVIKIVIEGIKKLFGDNYVNLILYLSILILALWLYKEFRIKMVEDEKIRKEKINNILVLLMDLEFELNDFIRNKSNFEKLKEKLISAYPYLSYKLSEKVSDFNPDLEETRIKEFLKELREEKSRYKINQFDELSIINEKYTLNIFEYHYKTKFKPFILPFFLTVFSLLIILIFTLILIFLYTTESLSQKLFLILVIINFLIFLIILLGFFDMTINKKIVYNWKIWTYLIIFLSFSVLSLVVFPISPASIVLFVFYILSFFLLPKILKKGE